MQEHDSSALMPGSISELNDLGTKLNNRQEA